MGGNKRSSDQEGPEEGMSLLEMNKLF